jgi:hypothetical protein
VNVYFIAAGVLAVVVGLVHSVLGERLIFRRMRVQGLIPTNGGRVIGEGHVRILWASWHVLTVFGWCFAALLFWLSLSTAAAGQAYVADAIAGAITAAMLLGAALVFVGTKARHPGWVGLLGVAVLTWLGRVG